MQGGKFDVTPWAIRAYLLGLRPFRLSDRAILIEPWAVRACFFSLGSFGRLFAALGHRGQGKGVGMSHTQGRWACPISWRGGQAQCPGLNSGGLGPWDPFVKGVRRGGRRLAFRLLDGTSPPSVHFGVCVCVCVFGRGAAAPTSHLPYFYPFLFNVISFNV